ncbi:hypothetical protein K469DRAFT_748131 [Zopfia rhizophila CBS 207.26]|uniref:Protein NO VEIN C-terminal domain-containing protein n=1 Tax=Zopfia rhizophila CBS 207.26 TaxID=1314779 RepID=A0A6A6ECX1_9PEZI|nr:hypothetical protein K469DRAFT_748131 [Zopfia rhizophila CBS 207.26]
MADSKREQARLFIKKLLIKNGGLSKEDREFLQREKPHILEAHENTRRKLGAATRTLATNLYAKDTRFVYELIQNAEDCDYSIAESVKETPCIQFTLDRSRIVIDSNEDGFSEKNIEAICSTGESTKTYKRGYIGEKGIGFKSVFKVAHKVHIQSEPFSFAFEYRQGDRDGGLGMVTPMNEEHLEVPEGIRTRMILHLLDGCDREALRKELVELPDTLLLFLRKLKSLSIKISLPGQPEVEWVYSIASKGVDENHVSIDKRVTTSNTPLTRHYWMTRRLFYDMPHDDSRKDIKEAEIVLAFPLDANDVPVIEDQHVFAFLPLRRAGYKFLIQSDFIAQASREDVFDSAWNNRLLWNITEVFLDNIDIFLKHDTLRHQWVRYIPIDSIADDFWGRLQRMIVDGVSNRHAFFSEANEGLWTPSSLTIVTEQYRDADGHPLLPDATTGGNRYISETYDQRLDLPILEKLGTECMKTARFLDRLKQDLARDGSRMRVMRSDPWHTKVANLLIRAARPKSYPKTVKTLPIVPLDNGQWVSPHNASIFYPTTGGVQIPTDLGLSLVDASALNNESRRNLFSQLGVTKRREMVLKDKMKFLRPEYYHMLEQCENRNGLSGIEWLQTFAQLKITLQLRRRDAVGERSFELEHIACHHSQFLLGVLEANWDQYPRTEICCWDEYFKSAKVPILQSAEARTLGSTYLPLPRLRAIAARLGLEEGFGFLQELENITDTTAGRWMFLERFGVGIEEDVSFWLKLLKQARNKESIGPEIVFDIYTNLQRFTGVQSTELLKEAFKQDVVFVPSPETLSTPSWTRLESCVWSGPAWFTFKVRLNAVKEYQSLYPLFNLGLKVADADLEDFLAYLAHIKDSQLFAKSKDAEAKVSHIYKQLYGKAKDADTVQFIRSRFDDGLVYNPNSQSWHNPSACVWAEDRIRLPGKVSLATIYTSQESFFCKVLAIPKPNLRMHIISLKQKALENPDRQQIFQEMLNICALKPTAEALKGLSGCNCLPVTLTSRQKKWVDHSSDFAIVDRREYAEIFDGKISMLDFSLEEVHSLRPFLLGLGLKDRYMSNAIREETAVCNGLLSQDLTNDLRRKAYAIFRYAAHLGSKRAEKEGSALHNTLQHMDVYISDDISKSVAIRQNNRDVTIQGDKALCHIDQQGDAIKLYVPRNKKTQQVCLARQLPITLLEHLGVERTTACAELGAIITASGLLVVDMLLQHAGIIEVEGVERPQDDDASETDLSENTVGSGTGAEEGNSLHSVDDSPPRTPTIANASDDPFLTPATSISDASPHVSERLDFYKELLDAVIRQAQALANLPNIRQTITAPGVCTNRIPSTSLAVSSAYAGERDFKIGAAGELFVFELLKGLGIPGFTQENWQSKIRAYVSVHEDYQNISNWPGRETADIVYRDRTSCLTRLLIEKGYLGESIWEGCTPTYYIEVKTTTSFLETPFFCSQAQYDRMERTQLDNDAPSDEIYLIARVFWLGDSGMGLKLYVDPATLRRDRELYFMTDKYSVTPTV